VGDFNDYETVLAFGRTVDVITVEIEHVNVDALAQLEKEGKAVNPSSALLRTIQDKGLQKQFYADQSILSPAFSLIESTSEITKFPIVQKMRTGGYDGQGVQILKTEADLAKAFDQPSVLEDLVDLEKEIGVMVGRNTHGEVQVFPPVEMEFDPELNLVKYVVSPANIDEKLSKKCIQLAKEVATKFELVGIMAVELFVTKTGEVLVNECAPRVHNSGHLTIEGASISQFEMHVRAVMGLPLPRVIVTHPSVMINLVGEAGHTGSPQRTNTDEV
jgi:5-(carboxyamino)imidazole ribonucleotide synthase